MITAQEATSIQELVNTAKTIYVALAANANYDATASALALFLSFKEAGKNVQIVCASPMRVEFSYLIGVDEIRNQVGNRNLVVSFAYDQRAVDKVSYHISEDSQRFNLVIAPTEGARPLDPSTVQYSYAGASADLVFIIGASLFEDLGEVYQSEQYFFDSADTVSITPFETQPFARHMFDTVGQTCMAEGVAVLLSNLGMEPKDDVATNVLSSLESATNRFQSMGMGPDSFELVARLMRNGARRSGSNPVLHGQPTVSQNAIPPMAGQQQTTQVSTGSFAEALKRKTMQTQQPIPQPQQLQQDQQPIQSDSHQIHQLQRQDFSPQQNQGGQNTQNDQSHEDNPPADWLKPKMFTGTGKV